MTVQKITCQERLQITAQLHADKWNSLVSDVDAVWTDADCLDDAKVTIAAQVVAIREFAAAETDRYLMEHGYIEPTTTDNASTEDNQTR
jgi:hypothetical protein